MFNMLNTLVEVLSFGRFSLEWQREPYTYVTFTDSSGESMDAVIDNTDMGE